MRLALTIKIPESSHAKTNQLSFTNDKRWSSKRIHGLKLAKRKATSIDIAFEIRDSVGSEIIAGLPAKWAMVGRVHGDSFNLSLADLHDAILMGECCPVVCVGYLGISGSAE